MSYQTARAALKSFPLKAIEQDIRLGLAGNRDACRIVDLLTTYLEHRTDQLYWAAEGSQTAAAQIPGLEMAIKFIKILESQEKNDVASGN